MVYSREELYSVARHFFELSLKNLLDLREDIDAVKGQVRKTKQAERIASELESKFSNLFEVTSRRFHDVEIQEAELKKHEEWQKQNRKETYINNQGKYLIEEYNNSRSKISQAKHANPEEIEGDKSLRLVKVMHELEDIFNTMSEREQALLMLACMQQWHPTLYAGFFRRIIEMLRIIANLSEPLGFHFDGRNESVKEFATWLVENQAKYIPMV
ncbi:MAG: hypothetical protein WC437_04875 [Patescibacteria group bacterium]|jgi:hypothetical protein